MVNALGSDVARTPVAGCAELFNATRGSARRLVQEQVVQGEDAASSADLAPEERYRQLEKVRRQRGAAPDRSC